MKIDTPIPITIIGGFLGSGKTSLLSHILQADHKKKIAVLINDFGQLNIDAEQISTVEGETISLTNGCICCTIRDDLLTEVLRLFEKPSLPDHIIIETSGVSDPALVAHTFLMPAMQGVVEVDSIISVVDAYQTLTLDDQFLDLAQRQISVADIVLINKIDLINNETLIEVQNHVKKIAKEARVIETTNSNAPLQLILGTNTFNKKSLPAQEDRKKPDFQTWTYCSDEQFTFMAIRKALEDFPSTIYRVKGFFHLESVSETQGIFQMTGGRAWLRFGKSWDEAERKTRLVFIGKKEEVNPEEINAHFDYCQQNYSRKQLDNSKPISVKNMRKLSIIFG